MKYYSSTKVCLECSDGITEGIFDYSTKYIGFPLCINCQSWFNEKKDQTTAETVQLYFALKQRGVPAELEKFDGYKTIDIAVVEARVNIEVDGGQHNFNPRQALADLKRTYYAFEKGFLTLRIPNSLVAHHLEQTADLITEFLVKSRDTKAEKRKFL